MHRRRLLELLSVPIVTRLRGAGLESGHVVVAGAGIMGASIAYHLAKRGARVTVLEKQRPGSGATEKSFAWLNANFSKQPRSYYDLNLLGIAGWRRLHYEVGEDLWVQWGGSVEWRTPGADADGLRRSVESHQQWGYDTHLVDEAAVSRLLPGIAPGPVGAACHSALEGTLDPKEALAALLKKARALGAEIQYPCEVTGLAIESHRVRAVETNRGTIQAEVLVLAAGVDTPRLARMAGVTVPLKESAGVLAHTAPRSRLLDRVALAPGAHIKQNPDGRIVTGVDFSGASTIDTSPQFGLKLLQNAQQYLPRLRGAPLEEITLGHRVMPQDGFPIVGFAERCANLYIAAMHSGITLSPIIGQLAAAEILDGATVDLLNPYRPSRFA